MVGAMHTAFGVVASVSATTTARCTTMLVITRCPAPALVTLLVQTAKTLDVHVSPHQ